MELEERGAEIEKDRKQMSNLKKKCFWTLAGICALGILYSAYRLGVSEWEYAKERNIRREVMEYKPQSAQDTQDIRNTEEQESPIVNPTILELQQKNADVIGWLSVPGTQIDYPFLWGEDYDTYLRRDIYGNASVAGAIFMDYRCKRDFTGMQTILFGHNMDNGSMFGDLLRFRERAFFMSHSEAWIYLTDATIKLELVACMIVDAANAKVYGVEEDTKEQRERFIEVLKEENIHDMESMQMDLTSEDRFVLLSTCSYEFEEARTVVVYRMVE